MKKIKIFGILAVVLLLFAQCKNEQKNKPKDAETQVEKKDSTATNEATTNDETDANDEGEPATDELKLPLAFSGEKPSVKDIAIALGQRFSVDVIGEEEAEMENPGSCYEAMVAAVKTGKAGEGEDVKIDEEKGSVWFKQNDDKTWGSVLAVLVEGEKAIVDLRTLKDGVLEPAQFDGVEVYKIDAANKVLVYEGMNHEPIVDDKGNLK